MKYKALQSFTSSNGNDYYRNQVITHSEYMTLGYIERDHFIGTYESETARSRSSDNTDIVDDVVGLGIGLAIGSMFDNDSSSSSDSSSDSGSSFDGFDGGSFGGGGASGDF